MDGDKQDSWQKTQDEALSEPVFEDEYFRKKPKKHGRDYPIVDAPETFVPVADTHAHLDMLPDPGLALARAAVHKVGFIETMVDPVNDVRTFEELDAWKLRGEVMMRHMSTRICGQGHNTLPKVRIAVGAHPHVAKDFDNAEETKLVRLLADARVSAVGEIGLDYHYDYSPRDVQKSVFRTQVQIAREAGLPVILHVREAFDDAFEVMSSEGWPAAGTLLHCYTSDAAEVARWVEAGCYVAFGGAFTFKKLACVREAAAVVPPERLLTETDAPFMTPEPFRGMTCEPAHVVFTAERIYNYLERENAASEVVYSDAADAARRAFFTQTFDNALRLLDQPPTEWQTNA